MFVKMVGTRYEVLRSLLNNSNIMILLNTLMHIRQHIRYCSDQEVGAWEMTNEND